MLFSPVYIESHPRPTAVLSASCISPNSFASYSFRTLAPHLNATVSSNPFVIKCLRTLCKIPGIGYPFTQSALGEGPLPHQSHPVIQPLCLQTLTDSFARWAHNNHFVINSFRTLSIAMGVYTPSPARHSRQAEAILCRTCTEGQSDGLGEYRTFKKSLGGGERG
jgi:hypothetical protein